MSTAAVVITGGYLAYEQFGPKPKPAAPSAKVGRIGDTASGSNEGSAAPPSADPGSAAGSATASAAGSATGSAAGSATEPAPGSGSSEPGSPKVVSLEVPRLIGMTPEKATAELTRLGFRDGALQIPTDMICSYEDEKRDLVPIGTICNQERTAGTQLYRDIAKRRPNQLAIERMAGHAALAIGEREHRRPIGGRTC